MKALHGGNWLIAATALAIAPLQPFVSSWSWLVAMALLLWRFGQQSGRLPAMRRWQLIALTLLATAGIFATYRSLLGQSAGSSLVVTLAALKLAETRNRRDATLLLYLDFFLCFVRFIFSQKLPEAALLLPQILLITAALTVQQLRAATPWRAGLMRAGRLLLQALPLALLLFVVFPRIEGPLWRLPQDSQQARSGLSDSMAPGNIASLSQSDEVAFRVQFDGTPPDKSTLYWRGPVLTRFDGRTWRRAPDNGIRIAAADGSDPISYSITQEPHNQRWIFALEALARLPADASLNQAYQLQAEQAQTELKRFQLQSWRHYRLPEDEADLQQALRLPAAVNPQARQLAQQWRAASQTPRQVVELALRHFNRQQFFYTLQPPLLGENPVDDFLFRSRRGFCEHYTSAFVFLMRAAGIPARVVTGYLGGELNPVGGYLIVRQSDAHAWAEVWLGTAGWQRIDPTAAVAPTRVEQGIADALPASDRLPLAIRGQPALLRALRLGWDSVVNRWNQQFLGYDSQRQNSLLQQLGIDELASYRMAGLIAGGALLALLPSLLWLAWSQRRPPADPVAAAYRRFCRRLAQAGLQREPAETASDFAQRASARWPQQQGEIDAITRLYQQLRYHPQPDRQGLRQLQQLAATFRPHTRKAARQ